MDSATRRFNIAQEGSAVTVCFAGRRLFTVYFREPGHGAAFATRVKEATTLDQVVTYIARTLRLYCDELERDFTDAFDEGSKGGTW
jgi:hypothetical protein